MSLRIEKLNVKLQKVDILHEVSLDIKDGEFISLLGASGCGKTTLLKSIAGLLDVISGDICIDGKSIRYAAPENILYHPVSREIADYFGRANYIKGSVRNGTLVRRLLSMSSIMAGMCPC